MSDNLSIFIIPYAVGRLVSTKNKNGLESKIH